MHTAKVLKFSKPSERLIVAADFKPDSASGRGSDWAAAQVLKLARDLRKTGVYIKVNSTLRATGYRLIELLHDDGVRVFADLKLYDIPETLENDGLLLQEAKPELLTVVGMTGVASMKALKKALPGTEILGVTVLTSIDNQEANALYNCQSLAEAVSGVARIVCLAGMDGFICSPAEARMLRAQFGAEVTINTPGIRPSWAIVPGDDQNPERIMTPAKAIQADADRIVVGRPITQAKSPYDAAMRTLEEIDAVINV